jgi:hypothetical protein
MASDFVKNNARNKYKGTIKNTVLHVTVPGGAYRTIKSPGKVTLNSISALTTNNCVLEVQDAFVEFPLFVVHLGAGQYWSLNPAQTAGELSLIVRNRTNETVTAKLEIGWVVL